MNLDSGVVQVSRLQIKAEGNLTFYRAKIHLTFIGEEIVDTLQIS